jgi:hypothetical protein
MPIPLERVTLSWNPDAPLASQKIRAIAALRPLGYLRSRGPAMYSLVEAKRIADILIDDRLKVGFTLQGATMYLAGPALAQFFDIVVGPPDVELMICARSRPRSR